MYGMDLHLALIVPTLLTIGRFELRDEGLFQQFSRAGGGRNGAQGAVVPSELDSDIFWQDILGHLGFALCLRVRNGNSESLQLSCLVPATPG